MINRAFSNIGDGLDAAMRVPRKPVFVKLWIIIAEIIHHQKRVKWFGVAKSKDAVKMDASPFGCWACLA
jgi:hypothetical protein